jgi:uncharacterized protein YeaO (DUF488 family)
MRIMPEPVRITIRRAYAAPSDADGTRVLVDRLWPRGLAKDGARIDLWLKDVAPSTELRRWFGHDPARWDEFRRRYAAELDGKPELVAQLSSLAADGPLTLLFAAHDEARNNAAVLRDVLLGREITAADNDRR